MVISNTDIREQLAQTLRRLRRDWAFTAAFVLTLALGIAANAAVFTARAAYFLRPLPYPQGEQLVDIDFDSGKHPLPVGSAMSAAADQRLRSARALSSSGLVSDWGNLTVAVRGAREASDPVAALSVSTLKTLDVRPLLGRWIRRGADLAGGPAEVDIGYRLWQSAFHGDSHALGRTPLIGGKAYTVVGVMPPRFAFPARRAPLWVSTDLAPGELGPGQLTAFNWAMIARLKAKASRAELDAQLGGLFARTKTSMPSVERRATAQMGIHIGCVPLRQSLGGATRARLLMMQLGAGLLLLLAVASLVDLALARSLRRRDEATLRVVLGAGRAVLVAQACREALPRAAAATLIAWPLTEFGLRELALYRIASMHELIRDAAPGAAGLARSLIAFGLLAVIGTYGVVAYVAGLRRREFAVRQAGGAEPAQFGSLVLGQRLLPWALGALLGVGCALVLAKDLAAELYRVRFFAAETDVLPAAMVGAAVMLAAWVPARAAPKLDVIAQIRPE
jgi:hypothetical protein